MESSFFTTESMIVNNVEVLFTYTAKQYGFVMNGWNSSTHVSYAVIGVVQLLGETVLIVSDYTAPKKEKNFTSFTRNFFNCVASDYLTEDSKRDFLDSMGASLDTLKAYKKIKAFKKRVNAQVKKLSKDNQELFRAFMERCSQEEWESSEE